jgi:hypothetical protein
MQPEYGSAGWFVQHSRRILRALSFLSFSASLLLPLVLGCGDAGNLVLRGKVGMVSHLSRGTRVKIGKSAYAPPPPSAQTSIHPGLVAAEGRGLYLTVLYISDEDVVDERGTVGDAILRCAALISEY